MSRPNDYSPIADLYDSYVADVRDHPFWADCARAARGAILELTAGTGRATVALRSGDNPIVCVDLSARMLRRLVDRFAGNARPPAAVQADICALPLAAGCFDLVAVPFNSLSEVVDDALRARAIAEAGRVLAPDGKLVVTLHNPERRRASLDGAERVIAGDGPDGGRLEVVLSATPIDGRTARSVQRYRRYDPAGILIEERVATIYFALPDLDWLRSAGEAAHLVVRRVFGDYDRSPFDPETSPSIIAEFARAQQI